MKIKWMDIMEKTEKKGKIVRNLILFNLLIVLTFYLILKDQDFNEMYQAFLSVKLQYILVAVVAMIIYVACEAINIRRMLKALNENVSIIKCMKYTLIGFFFSSITPAATGGQPMEIYYMYKEGVKVSHSTLALLMQLWSFQIITISFAIISVIINHSLLNSALAWLFVIGIALNSSALILLCVGIFSKRLSRGLINFAIKVLKFFKFKNIEEKQKKWEEEVRKYQESAVYIKEHKRVMIKTLLTTLVQIMAFYSVTYWIYRSFGLSEYSMIRVITMQAVLYATVSGIPSPGAVGVTEGGFVEIYKSVFPTAAVSSAMLLSRGVSFYLMVVISCIVVIISSIRVRKIPDSIEDEKNIDEELKDEIETQNNTENKDESNENHHE